jgi:hypothetical protein
MPIEVAKPTVTRARLTSWMHHNVERFVDKTTGEVNMTKMVETWDVECASGGATMDESHPAWEVAARVAARFPRPVSS